jgi:hypothetical protein
MEVDSLQRGKYSKPPEYNQAYMEWIEDLETIGTKNLGQDKVARRVKMVS